MSDTKRQRVVQLKDQTTSFHDFGTGFDIVRDQRKALGSNIGRATAIALQHGRLIEVQVPDEAPAPAPEKGKK